MITFLLVISLMIACQTETKTANNTPDKPVADKTVDNTNQTNMNSASTKSKANTESNPSSTEISLATPTEAYKTAYAARKNKDIKNLKRTLSKDMIEFFTMMSEGSDKGIDAELMKLAEKPQNPSDETRNEKINGDKAMLEFRDENGNWKTMDFIKEDGEWKLTINKPE